MLLPIRSWRHAIERLGQYEPIRVWGVNEHDIQGLWIGFNQDGKPVSRVTFLYPPVFRKENLREIKPGESVHVIFPVEPWYEELKPGVYDVTASYGWTANEVTKTEFKRQPIMRLHVVE